MPNVLAINGAQPDKATRFTSLYTGRYFSGIWTNRSPLRDAASSRMEEKYYGPRGDAMIAGSNVEITNRLTLARRPGNPIYSATNTATGLPWANVLSFDEFRINKGLSDVNGTVLEQVDVMVDTTSALYALNGANSQLVFTKSAGAGQSNGIQVGNEWYFGNGNDNKKWLQTLFTRTSASNNEVLQLNSYPLMDTFLIDSNGNIQQLIGANVQHGSSSSVNNITVTNVAIANNVLTITTSSTPATDQPIGTQFMLWGFTNPATKFLNGATVTLTSDWSIASTTFTSNLQFTGALSQADTAQIQIESGGTDSIHNTLVLGPSVPVWGTVVPSAANDYFGSITVDGQAIWINRGLPTENWGLAAPDQPLAAGITASGASTGWAANTYYSPASVYIDNVNGFLWQITTAGKTGAVQPTWPGAPTPQVKIGVTGVFGTTTTITVLTETQSLSVGDVVLMTSFDQPVNFLNGVSLTVLAGGLTTTKFTATFNHSVSYGTSTVPLGTGQTYAVKTSLATTQADGIATWTCIQSPSSLTWAAHTHYRVNDFLVASAGGTTQLFQLTKTTQPFIQSDSRMFPATYNSSPTAGSFTALGASPITLNAWADNSNPARGFNGAFSQSFNSVPTSGSAAVTPPVPGSLYAVTNSTAGGGPEQSGPNVFFFAVNGAGELGASTDSGQRENWEASFLCNVFIPAAGAYTFSLLHDDGAFFSFDTTTGVNGNAPASLGANSGQTNVPPTFSGTGGKTAIQGFTGVVGNNNSGITTDTATWNFPVSGNYQLEINWKSWEHAQEMEFTCTGVSGSQNLATSPDVSGTTQPVWPLFRTSPGQSFSSNTGRITFPATVQDAGGQYTWSNLGPISKGGTTGDFIWHANTPYTLPQTTIIDTNSNEEGALETGISGTIAPVWQTSPNSLTPDSPNLVWINEGAVPTQQANGKITATSAQGWIYGIALVNTLDNTVSNIGLLSSTTVNGVVRGTGPISNGEITFAPGAGLNEATIDPQADYVAIFRTTDGGSTELLIPSNGNTNYTVPLVQYLLYGFVDTTPDTGLDTLISAAQNGENTPPLPGAVNLTYHLNRIWYSIGNTVFFTTGPLATVGNGINGFTPSVNFDQTQSLVTRLVPTSIGMLVLTVSDIYIIPDNNGTILPIRPYVPGIGLSSYNALDMSGPLVGFVTTDHQFIHFNPSAGMNIVSNPIADQFRQQTGQAPTNWNPKNVYVAWYVNGDDMGWFVADGSAGWFRLINNPAPDFGQSWSPFASIAGGVRAIKAVETAPGVHNLLLGPTGSGSINARNLFASSDGGSGLTNGTTYSAFAVFGSYVLAQPGQVAQIAFVTTDSVNVGSPLILGILIDEALPYFTGSFEILKNWVSDPPGLPASKSILGQRFYLSELPNSAAACRHTQIQVQWPAESALNELQAFTIFGDYVSEA